MYRRIFNTHLIFISFIITISVNAQGRKEYKRIDEKSIELKVNRKNIKKGELAPLFVLPDANGDNLKLEDYKGNYVLLDFWASWCSNCRKHNRKMVSIYDKLKNKNFEIIGISLDRKRESWMKVSSKFNWKQVCDLKGIDSEIATQYGVQYVPNFILIDPQGIIINRYGDSSFENLEADLMRLFE